MTPEYIRFNKLFYIDEDGILRWKIKRRKVNPGTRAGVNRGDGYWRVIVNYKPYYVHRIVFLLTNGSWPKGVTDHADCNPSNNHPSNLRDFTKSQNGLNRRKL